MRKVFLDDLPKRKYGNNERVDWKNSVGYKVKFIYNDIEGEIEIIKYYKNSNNMGYIEIKYNDTYLSIRTDVFLKCVIGELLGIYSKKYKYKNGDILENKYSKIEILKQIRISQGEKSKKGYTYKCINCGDIDTIIENDYFKGSGCKVCSGYKILKGYNDLWTTHPQFANLLKYTNKGYEISHGSKLSEIFVCPNCGYEKYYIISNITRRNFSCPQCGDGISYPNKFIRSFFSQLNEEYIPEYSPKWAFIKHNNNPKLNGKKRYDNYLSNKNEVWEVHGLQHYEEGFSKISKSIRTLKEEQENDKIKKELAEQNGYKYIIVDARESNIEYIKNSLLNLPEIKRYDISKVDWNKCHEFACNSLVKVACYLWNSGIKSTQEIGKIMNLTYQTITRYLSQGGKLDWCNFNIETRGKK